MLDTCENYVVCDKCYDAEKGDRESLKTLEGWSRQMWEGKLSDLCEFCTGLVNGQGSKPATVKVYEPFALVDLWMQVRHPDEDITTEGILEEYAATDYDEIIRIIQEAGLDLDAIVLVEMAATELVSKGA